MHPGIRTILFGAGNIKFPFGAPIVVAGDSIVAHGFGDTRPSVNINGRNWVVWANNLLRSPFGLIQNSNAGVGGNTSTQLLARYDTDVTAYSPKVVVILIGTNDLGVGTDRAANQATMISNISSMLQKNRAIGAYTFLLKILPRGNVSIGEMTSGMITDWEAVNAWIATQGGRYVKVMDAESTLGAMDAKHHVSGAAQYFSASDNLHLAQLGAYTLGRYVLLPAMQAAITSGDILFSANNAAANYLANGFMTGGATTATGWTASTSSATGAGATVALSKVARSDGFGEWQQIAISGTYTGTTKVVQISRTMALTGLFGAGDTIQAACEIQVDANVAAMDSFRINLTGTGLNTSQNSASSNEPTSSEAWSGNMRTMPIVLSGDPGTVTFAFILVLTTTATTDPVSVTARFGRCQVVKV